jgi:hypothetical protein
MDKELLAAASDEAEEKGVGQKNTSFVHETHPCHRSHNPVNQGISFFDKICKLKYTSAFHREAEALA